MPAGVDAAELLTALLLYVPTLMTHGKSLLRCMIMASTLEQGHGVRRDVVLLLRTPMLWLGLVLV